MISNRRLKVHRIDSVYAKFGRENMTKYLYNIHYKICGKDSAERRTIVRIEHSEGRLEVDLLIQVVT